MAQLKEQLSQDILDNLKEKQIEINNLIMDMGQLSVQSRQIRNQLMNLDKLKASMEIQFDELNSSMNTILSELQTKYPNGEIDLKEGFIYFDSAE
jgi:predicted nuclease with TOPRIM domain